MRFGRWIETKNAPQRVVKADLNGSNLFGTRELQWLVGCGARSGICSRRRYGWLRLKTLIQVTTCIAALH